jgi:RND superfamily putative drug exporter
LGRLAAIVTGRRGKWLVLVAWVIAVAALMPLGSQLSDATEDETASFLPQSSESTEVVNILDREFSGGETAFGLLVYERDGGLTAADRRVIARQAEEIQRLDERGEIQLTREPAVPFGPGAPPDLVSPNGDAAYTVLTLPTIYDKAADWGKAVRDVTGERADGMRIFLTGDLGFITDSEEVFGDLDANLLLATVVLVLVLLGLIYRAVLVALTPLFVVFLSYSVATAFVYLYAESGADVTSNGTTILIVLMFGVGTDYSLLLVSRFREELRRIDDKHAAMEHALRRTGPTILASGATVALAMLVLALADTGFTKSLGPVFAIGVACAMVAGLTLLPALLTIFGRTGFWPRRDQVRCDPEHPEVGRQGVWRRIGDKVLERPAAALLVTVVAFVGGAIGLVSYKVDYSTTNFFKESVESVEGFNVLRASFPAGTLVPTTVLVERTDGSVTNADVGRALIAVRSIDGVARADPTGLKSDDGRYASIDVILDGDPYVQSTFDAVPTLRESVEGLGPGLRALVGGGSAIQYDFDKAINSDLRLIVPIALAVIAIILALLLWSLVAPLVLIASVILSFLCTLGLSLLFIRHVVGDPGIDASLPTFAFIFLVALGIDYTIFLMARVREEARQHGTREGMLRALAATGPVITSAGIILAGTFSVLMTLPVTYTFDLGFMVALGILLDTFIVRTIMVPAAVELIGDKIWWPSTADRGGALREKTHAEVEAEVEAAPAGS